MPTDPKPLRAVDEETGVDDDLDFDLEALRRAPQQMLNVEQTILSVSIRKPKTDEFFRTHVDDAYVQDLPLLQVEVNDRKELYFVAPTYRPWIADRLAMFRAYACINRAGTTFLWPIPLRDAAVNRRWRDSALMIADEARKAWVTKIVVEGSYSLGTAKGDLGDPKWPEMTFAEMVKLAFRSDDRVVRDGEHHIIRYINGQA